MTHSALLVALALSVCFLQVCGLDERENSTPLSRLVVLDSADEGMSSWRFILSELVIFARRIQRDIVEPCVLNGRISSCQRKYARGVDDYFRFSEFAADEGVNVVPFHSVNTSTFEKHDVSAFCMHTGVPADGCQQKGFDHSWHGISFERVAHESIGKVILLAYFRYSRRASERVSRRKLIPPPPSRRKTAFGGISKEEAFRLAERIPFSLPHLDKVVELRHLLGLRESYAAVHWRSERICHDYEGCASSVVKVKNSVCKQRPWLCDGPVLLISDIPYLPEQALWKQMSKYLQKTNQTEAARNAMQLFIAEGFVKLDAVASEPDPGTGFLAIWDLVCSFLYVAFFGFFFGVLTRSC